MTALSASSGFEDEGVSSFLFDFDLFEKLDDVGAFAQGRVELIEGRLIQMAPPGADHSNVISDLIVDLANAIKTSGVGGLRVVTQGTIKIQEHSGPEPDVFVARRVPGQKYYHAEDTVLVVEVSVTTLRLDQTVKSPMYARAAIAEYWIVDPATRSIRVHRDPIADGTWGDTYVVSEGTISPLFAPEIALSLADIFAAL